MRRSQNDKRDNALANILETIVPRLPVHAEHVLVRAMLARGHRIDTKPKRRLHEVLRSQGVLPRQHVTFFSDGGDTVRELPAYLHPHSEHFFFISECALSSFRRRLEESPWHLMIA